MKNKKRSRRIFALILIASMCVAMLAGCRKKESETALADDIYDLHVIATTDEGYYIATGTPVDVKTDSVYDGYASETTSGAPGSLTYGSESAGSYKEGSIVVSSSDRGSAEEVSEAPASAWPETSSDRDIAGALGDIEYTKKEVDGFYDDFTIEDPWTEPVIPEVPGPEDPWTDPEDPAPAAGLLTAGEWNDNRNFYYLRNLLGSTQDNYEGYFRAWDLTPFSRIVIHVSEISAASGSAVNMCGASVTVLNTSGEIIRKGKTDNHGYLYAYYTLTGEQNFPAMIVVSADGCDPVAYDVQSSDLLDDAVIEITVCSNDPYLDDYGLTAVNKPSSLDLMFVIDTTGSMGDELNYLKVELEDIITRVKQQNGNIPVRLSVNFYRDLEDIYVVRSYPFSGEIETQLRYLRSEYAGGGGDYEEAVELALDDAVNNHSWNSSAAKLMFLVLDAPPHNTAEIRESLSSTVSSASEQGIRMIPVASSGVDKSTEFLLRTFAMATGGTYTFLTDDSGIGGSHLTPTIGDYEVEHLNDMIVRIIGEYLE